MLSPSSSRSVDAAADVLVTESLASLNGVQTSFSETGSVLSMQLRFQPEFVNKDFTFIVAAYRHTVSESLVGQMLYNCTQWWRFDLRTDTWVFNLSIDKSVQKELSLIFALIPNPFFPDATFLPKTSFSRILSASKLMRKHVQTFYLSSFFTGFDPKKSASLEEIFFGRLSVFNSVSKQWNPEDDDSVFVQTPLMRRRSPKVPKAAILELLLAWDGIPILSADQLNEFRKPMVAIRPYRRRKRRSIKSEASPKGSAGGDDASSISISVNGDDELTGVEGDSDRDDLSFSLSPATVSPLLPKRSRRRSLPGSRLDVSTSKPEAVIASPPATPPVTAQTILSTSPASVSQPTLPSLTTSIEKQDIRAQTIVLSVIAKAAAKVLLPSSSRTQPTGPLLPQQIAASTPTPRSQTANPAPVSSSALSPTPSTPAAFPAPPPPRPTLPKQSQPSELIVQQYVPKKPAASKPPAAKAPPALIAPHEELSQQKKSTAKLPAAKECSDSCPGLLPTLTEMVQQKSQPQSQPQAAAFSTPTAPPLPYVTQQVSVPLSTVQQRQQPKVAQLQLNSASMVTPVVSTSSVLPPRTMYPTVQLHCMKPSAKQQLPIQQSMMVMKNIYTKFPTELVYTPQQQQQQQQQPQSLPLPPPQLQEHYRLQQLQQSKRPRLNTNTTSNKITNSNSTTSPAVIPPPMVPQPPPPQNNVQNSAGAVMNSNANASLTSSVSRFLYQLYTDVPIHLRAQYRKGAVCIVPLEEPRPVSELRKALVHCYSRGIYAELRSARPPLLTEHQARENVISQKVVPSIDQMIAEFKPAPMSNPSQNLKELLRALPEPSAVKEALVLAREARVLAMASAAVADNLARAIDKELKTLHLMVANARSQPPADVLSPPMAPLVRLPPNGSFVADNKPPPPATKGTSSASHLSPVKASGNSSAFQNGSASVSSTSNPDTPQRQKRMRTRQSSKYGDQSTPTAADVIDLTSSAEKVPTVNGSEEKSSSSAPPSKSQKLSSEKHPSSSRATVPLEDRLLVHCASHVPLSRFDRTRAELNAGSEFDTDESWRLRIAHEHIDDFLDISDHEKQYMKLWNEFMWSSRSLEGDANLLPELRFPKKLNHSNPTRTELPELIFTFIRKHADLFKRTDLLRVKLIQHLSTLIQLSFIEPDILPKAVALLRQ